MLCSIFQVLRKSWISDAKILPFMATNHYDWVKETNAPEGAPNPFHPQMENVSVLSIPIISAWPVGKDLSSIHRNLPV